MRGLPSTIIATLLATALAGLPAGAQPPGSPHETVMATVDGATISIEYGRPYMRGRKIMGGLVPYGRVWRTGADAATTLTTTAPLVVGGAEIPAGTVSLYTLPGETQWKLIINEQTGQPGTEYKEALDLARVDMQKTTLDETVDQFTIAIEPQDAGGGVIRMRWENTELRVPFTVRH